MQHFPWLNMLPHYLSFVLSFDLTPSRGLLRELFPLSGIGRAELHVEENTMVVCY